MNGLWHRLWSAAREYRAERRDFGLLKTFLESPAQREEARDSATPAAGFLMLAVKGFAESDLETFELWNHSTISSSILAEVKLRGSMLAHWEDLITSACLQSGVEDGLGFTFVTERAPVSIYVSHTWESRIDNRDEVDNIDPDNIKALLASASAMIKEFEKLNGLIFSKKRRI